jgi:hypothetical protein
MRDHIRCFLLLAAVVFTGLMSACASVPMATMEEDTNAKKFEVSSDQSRIYVYRNETFGGAIKIAVTLDGKMMGQTAPNTYFMWDVAPGDHTISCIGENVIEFDLSTRPGTSHFVWREMKMGMWSAGCALHEVDAATGKAAVMDTKLIQPEM